MTQRATQKDPRWPYSLAVRTGDLLLERRTPNAVATYPGDTIR